MSETFDYVDAMPINGYLVHAVRNQPENLNQRLVDLVALGDCFSAA